MTTCLTQQINLKEKLLFQHYLVYRMVLPRFYQVSKFRVRVLAQRNSAAILQHDRMLAGCQFQQNTGVYSADA